MEGKAPATPTVIGLSVFLVCLVALLIFLYKKLNKETNGEYTIHQMVYKEGGIRDRVRRATLALETRLGVHLWPRDDSDEEGEEMQEFEDEEGQVEEGDSRGSGSEGDDQEDEDEEEEEEGEDEDEDEDEAGNNALLCGKGKGKGDGTSEKSNLEDSDAGGLTDQSEAQEETDEKKEKKGEKEGDGEGKVEASGGTGLLIDFKQFSGSAIWSEESKVDGDMTVL